MSQPIILVDPGASRSPDRPYWTTPEMGGPSFHTAEVARVFFGRNAQWMKRALREEQVVHLDGGPVRPGKGSNGYFVWTLHDIERFAHALTVNRLAGMSGQRLELVIIMVRTSARLYGLVA